MNVPTTIGIIMDGNRRWARENSYSLLQGHTAGKEKLVEVVGWAKDVGIKNLLVYAFSTENWNRAEEELSYLSDILEDALDEELSDLVKKGVRARFIGQIERFAKSAQAKMRVLEQESKDNREITLGVCLSYGGRQEIVEAINYVITNVITPVITTGEDKVRVDEGTIDKHLWTTDIPDPDLVIRTGGERRLSNFLTWQAVYSELYFSDTYWPVFSKEEFDAILAWYSERDRRYGK
jgi:undecaprenyl diphosphate synthase